MSSNRVCWLPTDCPADSFPPVTEALIEPDGLLAAGGDLGPERILNAYRNGIFPWYDEGQPLLWWSPDPRCVFLPGDYRVSRRLQRTVRSSNAEIRINTAFTDVILACAGPRRSEQGTWISADMVDAYQRLHERGWAHSIEVWDAGRLVGGLYGLAIGKVFFGESMFSVDPNASKLALLLLANMLGSGAFTILDCQVVSAHLQSLGARTLPRDLFIKRLKNACSGSKPFESWPITPISCSRLLLK